MKNTKRMLAVIAASGLALGAMPGVANAQGTEAPAEGGSSVLGLNLDLLDVLGVDLAVDLGSATGEGADAVPTGLLGSLENLGGTGSGNQEENGGDNTGSSQGSNGSGSAEDGTEGGGDDSSGSSNQGSNQQGSNDQGSNNGTDGQLSSGSLTPNPGTGDGDDEEEDAPGFLGSLEDIFSGSSEAGSDNGSGSDEGTEDDDEVPGDDEDEDAPTFGSGDINVNGSLGTEEIMMLGSLAGAGIAVGLAVSGGVNLPPLPEVNLGFVCQLPQEGIDFLKNNGSMERDECEPEDQQN